MAEFHFNASVLVLWVLAHHHGFTGTLRAIVNITNTTYFHNLGGKSQFLRACSEDYKGTFPHNPRFS